MAQRPLSYRLCGCRAWGFKGKRMSKVINLCQFAANEMCCPGLEVFSALLLSGGQHVGVTSLHGAKDASQLPLGPLSMAVSNLRYEGSGSRCFTLNITFLCHLSNFYPKHNKYVYIHLVWWLKSWRHTFTKRYSWDRTVGYIPQSDCIYFLC